MSIVKLKSNFCPKRNKDYELESMCSKLEQLRVSTRRTRDNIPNEREGLSSLVNRTSCGEIVKNPADKGSFLSGKDVVQEHDSFSLKHIPKWHTPSV